MRSVLLLTFILAGTALGQGGPPLSIDDTGTPGAGVVELITALQLELDGDSRAWAAPVIDLAVGLGDQAQVTVTVPLLGRQEDAPGPTHIGVGRANVGFKYRFLEEEDHGFSASVGPNFDFEVDGSAARRGLDDDRWSFNLPVQLQFPLYDEFGLGLEAAWSISEDGANGVSGGIALSWALTEDFELVGDIVGESSGVPDLHFGVFELEDSGVFFDVGFRWAAAEDFNVLFSLGRDLFRSRAEHVDLRFYLGFQFVF
ncbi:MAG: hypothetical protein R3F20_00425 [Planctomycetota bacterium]